MPAKVLKTLDRLNGWAAECLVQAYAILGANGLLDGFYPATDVDHKDLIVDLVGGFSNANLQIKCATQLKYNRIQCTARYFGNDIPEDPRFAYVFCLLDRERMELARIWLVPSEVFNRLANRSTDPQGRVTMFFICNPKGDAKWDEYEVDRHTLGPRLVDFATAPGSLKATRRLDLSSALLVRARLKAA